jgi:hypothetical protein
MPQAEIRRFHAMQTFAPVVRAPFTRMRAWWSAALPRMRDFGAG